MPILLAAYMSLHRWKPVKGKFLGFSQYEKALGDLGGALFFLIALFILIGATWVIVQDWRRPRNWRLVALVLALTSSLSVASVVRAFRLEAFIEAYRLNKTWAVDLSTKVFPDRYGDPMVQLDILSSQVGSGFGAAAILVLACGIVFFGQFTKIKSKIIVRVGGGVMIFGSLQAASFNWSSMMAAGDQDFLRSLINTVFYSAGTVSLQISLGLLIAFALYRKIRGFGAFRFLIFLPYVTPVVAMASVFSLIFGARESSLSNQILSTLGFDPLVWITDRTPIAHYLFGTEITGLLAGPSVGMLTAIVFGVWSYTGYNAVILLAGLTAIPADLYEAAELEGATLWQTFRYITMPLLSPVIFFLVITGLIGTFQAFTHIYVMLGNTVNETLHTGSIEIWRQISLGKFGYSSALAVILFILILVLTISQFALLGRRQHFGN